MNDLLAVNSIPEQVDPQGSLVDANLGAYYTGLNLMRLPGVVVARFIACHEGGNEAIAIAPSLSRGTASAGFPEDIAA
jgi:hypothetical protein